MREIKFRAWCRCGEWDEEEDKQEFKMIDPHDLAFEEFAPLWELLRDQDDHCYFMQYTGLKDKNGKEIYEGDIVRDELNHNWVVKFMFGAFGLYHDDVQDCSAFKRNTFKGLIFTHNKCKIIGNIYENPDLINSDG